ncbi:HEPN domain-containing protein [Nitrospira sp. Kam-Ns4a]
MAQATPLEASDRRTRLRQELERIRQVLANEPTVLQLRVFGSVATERVHEWSDLDLFVVMRSSEPFVSRSARLATLTHPRVGVQFLAYTPEEAAACLHRPFFREEILKKGAVMPLHPQEDATRWLTFAAEDLRMAELALEDGLFNQACFHAQQCAEKALKALCARRGEAILRTHALMDLCDRLPDEDHRHMVAVMDALPGLLPSGMPQRVHADTSLATARSVLDVVTPLCR